MNQRFGHLALLDSRGVQNFLEHKHSAVLGQGLVGEPSAATDWGLPVDP